MTRAVSPPTRLIFWLIAGRFWLFANCCWSQAVLSDSQRVARDRAPVLTQRLAELEAGGVITRQLLPPPACVQICVLTRLGLLVRPVIGALCRLGVQLPGHDPRLHISPTALMLSMTEMFVPGTAGEVAVAFDMGTEQFLATAIASGFTPVRTRAISGQLTFSGTTNALAAVIYGPRLLAQSVAEGNIAFQGDLETGQVFVDFFGLRHGINSETMV